VRALTVMRVLGVIVAVTATMVVVTPSAQARDGAGRPGAAGAGATSVDQLRLDVVRTGDRLAAATIAWEAGQQRLAVLIQRKISTGQAADALAVDARQAQLRISALANALYRNPFDPMLTAVLTGDANALSDVAFVQRTLRQTSSDQQRDARLLTTRAVRAKALVQTQGEAASEAVELQKRLDAELLSLQADAQASLGRLQAALAEIRRREAAASAAAAAALGASTATGSGATCTSEVPADAINGFLPASALCPLRTASGQRLIAPAAAAFDAMSLAFRAALHVPLCVTDSYRDYASQVRVFATKPNLAATPGRSKHGLGRAVDLCGGVQNYGTAPYNWLKQNAPAFGFAHPDWAEPDGSRPEPWHWEFQG
jgi:D-alanyl-D-alanine carboxypeptidase